ncbi:dephospho-CoA kinase-like [Portunus trituberculatus]|uniref:dephospho-CoA kinase-like n=1 Tax=Portunus trituberculatus TaxID=210409 RepID=UPI001E1CE698|nr:dephospho-CoA kinase-like [Portunus trituberculatus]
MFLVGLTGGIASGKTTVSDMMREMGVPVVDADLIARQVVEPGKRAWSKIKAAFGDEVFHESGEVNRERLGQVVFADMEKRRIINKITHPEIYREIQWQVIHYLCKGEQFVVLDLPLLYESNKCTNYLFKTIVVTCEDELQLERLVSRNSYTEKEAIARIEAQMPLERKCKMADFVIENSGSKQSTRKQVEDIVKYLRSSRHHLYLRGVWGGGLVVVVAVVVGLFIYFYL